MNESQFLKSTTILPVKDIYETLTWYQDILGFENVYVYGGGRRGDAEDFANYAISRRDSVEVHFIMDEGGPSGHGPELDSFISLFATSMPSTPRFNPVAGPLRVGCSVRTGRHAASI